MGKISVETCDLCGSVMTEKNGLTIEIGYSKGGWGQRRNWLNWSGEVCPECFDVARVQTRTFRDTVLKWVSLTRQKFLNGCIGVSGVVDLDK